MVVLFFFLYEWRIAVISVVAIPLSLMAAGLVLYLRDTTVNTMVLAGLVIALGAVVDDAIIDVENISRRLRLHRQRKSKVPITTVILEASVEVRHAIVFATLIEVVALLPVFFMEGLSGAFFQPLAISYALAVLASLVVALTVTPALSLILLSRGGLRRRESPVVPRMQRAYHAVLSRVVQAPRGAFLGAVALVVAGLVVVPLMGQSLLPEFKERDLLMHWLAKPGTSQPEMARITTQASIELRQLPAVRNFGAHIGQALIMDEVVGMYFGENWVSLDPDTDYDEAVASVQEVVDGYPGLVRDVQTYLKERIREVLTGSSEAVVVRIYGQDLDTLRNVAQEVEAQMAQVEGLVDLHVELQTEIPQIQVKVDLERAERYALKPGDVRRAAGTLVSGLEVGRHLPGRADVRRAGLEHA